jgi:hypothetical protein
MHEAVGVVPYEALQQPLSPLFLDYLAGHERARPFLRADGFELGAITAAAERAIGAERQAGVAAEALARQQEAMGSARAAERARALGRPGAAAVVTGQQAGLFGGPLFVLWKALATVAVARRLEAERGKPVVPVFWVASDDHDFAEIRATTIVDASGALRTLRYAPVEEPLGRPAWDIVLDDSVRALVDELARALPPAGTLARQAEGLQAPKPPRRPLPPPSAADSTPYRSLVVGDDEDLLSRELQAAT